MPRRSRNVDYEVEDAMMRQVGRRLLAARLEARLSQTSVGQMLGVTAVQIGGYEKGSTMLPLPRALLLAAALEIDLLSLLPSPDEIAAPSRKRVEEFPEMIQAYAGLDPQSRKKVLRFIDSLVGGSASGRRESVTASPKSA